MAKITTAILKGVEAETAFAAAEANARKYLNNRSNFQGFELTVFRNSLFHGNGKLLNGFAYYPAFKAKNRPAVFITAANTTELKAAIKEVRASFGV